MQAAFARGSHDKVHVIWHQAVCNDLNHMFLGVVAQQAQVGNVITPIEENALTMISPLGDVVRNPWKHGASLSRHT